MNMMTMHFHFIQLLPLIMLILILQANHYVYTSSAECNASIGECDDLEGEFAMESEISRRFLEEQNSRIPYKVMGCDQIKNYGVDHITSSTAQIDDPTDHDLHHAIKLSEIETLSARAGPSTLSPKALPYAHLNVQEALNLPKMCKTTADRARRLQLHMTLILILILGLAHLSIRDGVLAKGLDLPKSLDLGDVSNRVCGGGSRKGLAEEEDAEMDSESNRRLLLMQPKRYVSYDTLRKDMVPCERPGASYYNCRSGGVANPYTRGCEMIAGCARSIRDVKT